jgi:hypothetical protein
MPNIKSTERDPNERIVRALLDLYVLTDGDIKHTLTRYCHYCVPRSNANYNNFADELIQVANEIKKCGGYVDATSYNLFSGANISRPKNV